MLIRQAVSRLSLENVTCGEATISIGIAFYPNDATESEPLLRKADQALYQAKHDGRNQVSVFKVLSGV